MKCKESKLIEGACSYHTHTLHSEQTEHLGLIFGAPEGAGLRAPLFDLKETLNEMRFLENIKEILSNSKRGMHSQVQAKLRERAGLTHKHDNPISLQFAQISPPTDRTHLQKNEHHITRIRYDINSEGK